jgi:hypothetical protein
MSTTSRGGLGKGLDEAMQGQHQAQSRRWPPLTIQRVLPWYQYTLRGSEILAPLLDVLRFVLENYARRASYANDMPPVSLASIHTKKYFAAIRMLAYRVGGNLIDEYLWISETTFFDSMYKFCKVVLQFSARYLSENQMLMTLPAYCRSMKQRGFQRWLEAYIICIGSGRTSLLHGRDNIAGMQKVALWFLRLLHHIIYGFDTLCHGGFPQWHQHAPALLGIL